MLVIGLLVGLVGLYGEGARFKTWFARLMLAANAMYTFLDFRASDSAVGTGLYPGQASLLPAFVNLFVTLLFAHLAFSKRARER